MNQSDESIGGNTATSLAAVSERDLFLELWATEMLVRRRAGEIAQAVGSEARRLLQSEIGAANARATLMLTAVLVVTSGMIAVLEQMMPAWRAALVTSIVMTALGLVLLQDRWVTGAVGALRSVRRDFGRRELARIRISR